MKNGWTGGQYSLVRIALGLYLAARLAGLVPFGFAPSWFGAALLLAVTASLFLAVGLHDRAAAVIACCLGTWLVSRHPLLSNPGLPYLGFLLVAHACLPKGPYGSLAARGRNDPGGGWRFPPAVFAVAWVLLAVGHSYGGLTKLASPSWTDGSALARVLDNPLPRPGFIHDLVARMPDLLLRVGTWGVLLFELLFAPLALLRRARPWLWLTSLSLHLPLILLIDFADRSLGMVLLHLFTFDPAWVRGKAGPVERLFYDGSCALCHGTVRFVLAEDPDGRALRFAPLESEAFRATVPEGQRGGLPDSIVVATADGRLLTRSSGVLHILERLGGVWRVAAVFGRLVPARLRDAAYDAVARVRYRLFGRKDDACPFIPAALRGRFDL